jgi:hypothetical protein
MQMISATKELYHSSNGDRRYPARDPITGRMFDRHQANPASGGHVADTEISVFLSQSRGPEEKKLLLLIGTLVGKSPATERPPPQRGGNHLAADASQRNWTSS